MPWYRSVGRYLLSSIVSIAQDAVLLLRTKTAYGFVIASVWISLTAVMPPAQQTSAQLTNSGVFTAMNDVDPVSETGAGAYMPQTTETGANIERLAEIERARTPALLSDTEKALRDQPEEPQPEVVNIAALPVQPAHQPWNQRGVFLTPSSIGSEEYRDRTLAKLREVGGNALIFDVKGSAVHFDAQNTPLAEELGLVKPWYKLEDVIKVLHENGIYAIARYIAVKDHSLAEALPQTNLKNPQTGQDISPGWIDPAQEDVLEYNRQIICELAASGVDEINLDYIRYDTRVGEVQSAYTGEERIAKIETFIKMAREAINSCGPHAKLGVSTFAIIGWDYERNVPGIGQDVVRFAPLLDVISPMAYNANFSMDKYGDPTGERGRWEYLVYRTLTGYAEELGPEHAWKLRPWLQGWGVGTSEMQKQIQGAFDAGSCGFLVWNADNAYQPAYNAMENITVPEHCRGQAVAQN